MTLPPLPDLPKPAYLRRLQRPDGGYSMVPAYTPGEMCDYAKEYARTAIAAHVPEAAFGNIAAVPAQPVAWLGGDGHPHHISAVQTITERRIYGPWQPLYAAPQAVPVPAWQPIETVPAFPFVQEKWFKTGPRYLLAERSRVFIGSYSYTERGKGRWQDLVSKNCEPTHWMPLPAAPKEQPHE